MVDLKTPRKPKCDLFSCFKIPQKYIIDYTNSRKRKFDVVILFMAVFNSFVIPIEISFNPKELEHPAYVSVAAIIDLFFILDIVLMFFTSYQDKKGKQIKNSAKIAKRYMTQ